jgi:hypothetical protein
VKTDGFKLDHGVERWDVRAAHFHAEDV